MDEDEDEDEANDTRYGMRCTQPGNVLLTLHAGLTKRGARRRR